jgi:DNA polymerase elongation subunit (family B)
LYLNIFYERPNKEQYGNGIIHVWDDQTGYKKVPYKRYAYKLSPDGMFKTLFGQKAKKVYRWTKQEEENGLIFEGDVNPETRYLIDTYTKDNNPSSHHVVMNIDIEVDTKNKLPDVMEADNTITAIAYYNSRTNEYDALVLDENYELTDESFIWKDNAIVNLSRFDNETDLLKKFVVDYKRINPTILTGWNIDNFDVPYLYNRLKRVFNESVAKTLSPIGVTKYNPFRKRYFLAGVSCLDYLTMYKTFVPGVMQSFKLDSVAKKELGRGKIAYEGSLSNLFKTDKQKFIEYNLTDVELVKSLDDKLKFIDLAKGICHKGHVPLEDVYFSSRYLDGAILTYMKIEGIVAPNRPVREVDEFDNSTMSDDDSDETFTGAYVKNPVPGMYEWLIDLDFTSLYPSIIMSLNISPETKVCKVDNWDANDFAANVDKHYEVTMNNKTLKLNNEKMRKFLTEYNLSIASNGIIYHNDSVGVIIELLDRWFQERVEYRALQKKFGEEGDKEKFEFFKSRQHVQKIILNSLYGVLGLPTFRFYDIDNAEAVTTTGVDVIKFAERVVNNYFNNRLSESKDRVIYMDTDSLFFSMQEIVESNNYGINVDNNDEMIPKVLYEAKLIQDHINKAMDTFALKALNVKKHRFNIKQELVARRGIYMTKKRYALKVVHSEGFAVDKLEFKGLDVVRTTFPSAFKDFMTQMLKDILENKDKDYIDKAILDLKKSINTQPISNIARPTGIKNISKYTNNKHQPFTYKEGPAHVKASINYNDFIRYNSMQNKIAFIDDGEKIKWVYLKNNPFRISELAFRDNEEDPIEIHEFIQKYIDRDKIFDTELENKLSDFYTALKWGNLPTNINQNFSKFF